mmetsp:Transcript_232/g.657  ORF Transcript_232/g.657 Transcript_232/m.657 type:complete len:84 (+) Transcript_232:33-284(+)
MCVFAQQPNDISCHCLHLTIPSACNTCSRSSALTRSLRHVRKTRQYLERDQYDATCAELVLRSGVEAAKSSLSSCDFLWRSSE